MINKSLPDIPNLTLAYFQNVTSLGVATSRVVARRAGSFWISLAIMIDKNIKSFSEIQQNILMKHHLVV